MADPAFAHKYDGDILAAPIARVMGPAGLHAIIVENLRDTAEDLRSMLREQMYRVSVCPSSATAMAIIEGGAHPTIAFFDSGMTTGAAQPPLTAFREVAPWMPLVAISDSGDTRHVVEAMRNGATDALVKPFDKLELRSLLQRHSDNQLTGGEGPSREIPLSESSSFVFCNQRMEAIAAQSALIAKFDIPILIMGESGTGKEILAHYIHQMSRCKSGTFLKVNCAAMPADLLESELLGYEQGAFTGATRSKPGKFELCDNGTIFLDEIGEMSAGLQAKLLQVLQDGTFSRLGGRTTVKVNVRVIAATNINIKSAIAQKRFREDLYYRLNGFSLTVPPLRERTDEIPVLMKYFIRNLAHRYARHPVTASHRLVTACKQWPWPGNVRELESFIKRYLILGDERAMLEELDSGGRLEANSGSRFNTGAHPGGLKGLVRTVKREAEAEAINSALRRNQWKHKQTAADLQISYKALLYKLRQYHIVEPHKAGLPEVFN